MFKSLLSEKFNLGFYFIVCTLIRLLFFKISFVSYVAVCFSLFQFILLFNSFGAILPTRHLLSFFMCMQFFIGPVLAYNGLDDFQYLVYKMKIPEGKYFEYVMPAVLLFILGLHIIGGKYEGEIVKLERLRDFMQREPLLPYIFLGTGFFSSLLASFFSSDLGFVFYLLGGFKFVGLFMLILGTKELNLASSFLVIGSVVSTSFNSGMFHDLITWVIYLAAIYSIRYKFTGLTKLVGLFCFLIIVIVIQVLKGTFREELGAKTDETGTQVFLRVYENQKQTSSLFDFERLAQSNVRINQGFIITNIMHRIPEFMPHENGAEMYKILEAAILPRFLAPDKLSAGNRDIFMKYSGVRLREGTSMGLSSIGDAYINWGVFGGCVFMFFLGMFYSKVLSLFQKYSETYPVLILFVPLVFYYPIRPDCELQTILGHLIKSCFLISAVFFVFKKYLKIDQTSG